MSSDPSIDSPPDVRPRPRRRGRRVFVLGLILVAVPAALVFSAPYLLGTAQGNRFVLARLNRIFSPGRLEFAAIKFGWNRPTTIRELTLFDPNGRPVLRSADGILDRSFAQLLLRPKDLGTLRLQGSRLDLAKTPSGEINLVEALGGVFDNPDPKRELTIRILGGLTVDAPNLGRRIEADSLDFEIRFRPRPEQLTWTLAVAGPRSDARGRLSSHGRFDRWRAEPGSTELPNLTASVEIGDWPFETRAGDRNVAGRLVAEFDAGRATGRWNSRGKGELQEFAWDETDGTPPEIKLAWATTADGNGIDLHGDFAAKQLKRIQGPFAASFDLAYAPASERLDVRTFTADAPLVKLKAEGSLLHPFGDRTIDLRGVLDPDYPALTRRLAEKVEPNARVWGEPSPWTIRGKLAGTDPSDLSIEGGFSLVETDVYGMKLGPTPIRARYERGSLAVDPIETTLNGGRLVLRPVVDLDSPKGPVLKLGSDSGLTNAEINDEVSRRVLSFAAPVLNQATEVNGRISAEIRSAEFPLSGDVGRKANVEGIVVFRDATFEAGPFSKELLSLVVRDPAKLESPLIRLNDPVRLTIADGRVVQRGLALPVGSVARLEVEGWVDFDRNLGLSASIPFSPTLFSQAPILNGAIRATKIVVPIGGTLDQPKIDGAAFKDNLARMGRDVLTETGTQGLIQLFSKLAKPRDPDAPPPPPKLTAEERKAKRQRQREERQQKKIRRSND